MRRQLYWNRLGLIFGAGLSKDFGIPSWEKLIDDIAKDPEVQGRDVLEIAADNKSLPYRTEMLYEHFKQAQYTHEPSDTHHSRKLDYMIGARWRNIIRKYLYTEAIACSEIFDKHPYIKQYLPIVKKSHMTVTYNFDDYLEQALFHESQLHDDNGRGKHSRGFESVTNSMTQFREPTGNIYHPNGVISQDVMESSSDRFVFSEASFAEQLIGIFAGEQAGLLNYLSKHTCLLIGLSLNDETFRNVLM